MTLRPTDMLQIQSAIDEYEKKFPRRPAPSAEVALAWRMGKRVAARFVGARYSDDEVLVPAKRRAAIEEPPTRKIRLGWFIVHMPRLRPSVSEVPALTGVVRLGWWGMLAMGTASVFVLGAFVGGFK